MSQEFKSKFDEMLANRPETPAQKPVDDNLDNRDYPASGNIRDLIFILKDGAAVSLNYAYLVEKRLANDKAQITITFTTAAVKIKGLRLENLFYRLTLQFPRIIECTDARYNALEDKKAIVNEIEITEL